MSFIDYEAAGLKLCAIERGQKSPSYDGWNVIAMPAESVEVLGGGAGLLHALSGTCALDIDNLELARPWLAEHGIDVDGLMADPTSVMISSGRPGRGKLLYRLSRPLRTLRPKGSGIELRCATAAGMSVQDVLPPSIHPVTGKPYEWKYGDELIGHWSNIPAIPAQVARLWRELATSEPSTEVLGTRDTPQRPIELVRKAIKHYIESRDKDVTDYDDWLDVGMRLHEETGGSAQGLEVWDEWSRTDHTKRKDGGPRYQGFLALKAKWHTFGEGGGRHVSMEGIIRELPAERDEFEVIPVDATPSEDDTAAKLKKAADQKKADALAELEKRVVYVRGAEKFFDLETHRIIQTESALQNLFMPMMPRVKGGGRMDPVKALKQSQSKTIVSHIGFDPSAGAIFTGYKGDKYANTYRNRLPAAIEPTANEREIIEWLFDRLGDPTIREYYLQFLAHMVQRPGVKIRSAPLFWSEEQGNGKSTLIQRIPALLVGPEYSTELTGTTLADSFTGYLMNYWHVTLKEFRAGSRGEREAISKKVEAWISDDTVNVRPMHQLAFTMPNKFAVTASSNAEDAAAVTNADRKWAICEMKGAALTQKEMDWIFSFVGTEADEEHASAALRGYFMGINIDTFNPNARAPYTQAKAAMADANISSDVEWLTTAWEERAPPFDRDVVITGEVTAMVHKHCTSRPNGRRVGKILTRPPFNGVPFEFRAGEGKYRAVILRNAATWRSAPGRQIMNHIQGNDVDVDDPNIDPLLQ